MSAGIFAGAITTQEVRTWPIATGTDGSNPSPSSGESANFRRSSRRLAPSRSRNRSDSGQRDRDLWPGGNTAPETTLLSGYGVDTLRRADNVRGTGNSCCPGEFQRGLTRRGKGAASGWGDIPDAAPRTGLARHAEPDPILYSPRVNEKSVAGMTALDFVSSRTRPGGLFLTGSHATATASDHCAAASARKIRKVDREIRWR